jgi:hypothetical protein
VYWDLQTCGSIIANVEIRCETFIVRALRGILTLQNDDLSTPAKNPDHDQWFYITIERVLVTPVTPKVKFNHVWEGSHSDVVTLPWAIGNSDNDHRRQGHGESGDALNMLILELTVVFLARRDLWHALNTY